MYDATAPLDPLPASVEVGKRSQLIEILRRIDGWGEHGWRLIHGAWQVRGCTLVIEPRELDADPLVTLVVNPSPVVRVADAADAAAVGDWALARLRHEVVDSGTVRCVTADPSAAVRLSSAAVIDAGRLCLRLVVRLPFAGLCCDGTRFQRFVTTCERFVKNLRPDAQLRALRKCVAIQHALRAALPQHGLIAFLAEGSRLARGNDGGPAANCLPLAVPKALRVRIDLGRLGVHQGLGIRAGITACVGAPYHGKSTLLHAIAAGRDAHRPGDGREGVVCRSDALVVQAEEGRPIHRQDLRRFFRELPQGDSSQFSTARASGATSMAASICQGLASGSRVLIIDEDTAAGNFLWMDATMRRLLGSDASGTTLCAALPALAHAGVSTVLAVGSATPVLSIADRVIMLSHFQPRDISARVRRLKLSSPPSIRLFALPERRIVVGDLLLGARHRLQVDTREPERPRIIRDDAVWTIDLRRSGWVLDDDLARSACLAAAWCLRLAGPGTSFAELADRYQTYVAKHGPCALDPYATTLTTLPPWPLVVSVLERLPVAVACSS